LQNLPSPPSLLPDDIATLTAELERLDANIYELGQMAFVGGRDRVDRKCITLTGDPDRPGSPQPLLQLAEQLAADPARAAESLNRFQAGFTPRLRRLLLQMAATDTLHLSELTSSIRDRFISRDGDEYLVTVYPRRTAWDIAFLRSFASQLEQINPNITGTPPLFLALIEYIGRDGVITTLLTILVVLGLLWLDFRSLRLALLAMIPLLVGGLWMVGLLHTSGLMLTFVNVTALPMIVGIGIDDGVHMIHRYRGEGWLSSRQVLLSTGKAIFLTTLTTMLGFGAMLGSAYRGLVSLSLLLMFGLATCFITTVVFLPPLMRLLARRN